jgi:hypothetical protein
MTILAVANETAASAAIFDAIRAADRGEVDVTIVAPSLNSRVQHWCSDDDDARRAAELRLALCMSRLARAGIEARGWVGDADPLQAIADAVHAAPVELLIVSTTPRTAPTGSPAGSSSERAAASASPSSTSWPTGSVPTHAARFAGNSPVGALPIQGPQRAEPAQAGAAARCGSEPRPHKRARRGVGTHAAVPDPVRHAPAVVTAPESDSRARTVSGAVRRQRRRCAVPETSDRQSAVVSAWLRAALWRRSCTLDTAPH